MALILSGDTGPSFVQTAAMPTGTVLQIVQGTSTTQVTTTSASLVTTGLTASITPRSASNKILVTITGGDFDTQGGGIQVYGSIYRNSTHLFSQPCTDIYSQANRLITGVSLQYLDSPATTSATSYTLYFYGAGNTVKYNSQSGTGVITLQEIAG